MPSTNPRAQPRYGSFRRLSRRPVTLAGAFVLALTAVIVPASTATAASIDAECVGTFTRNFSPAVTVTPQPVTVTEHSEYSTCAVGSTATGTQTLTLTLGCVSVTTGPAAVETLTWKDAAGGISIISWSAPTVIGQTVVFTGAVTAGRHAGDTATKVTSGISYVGSVLACVLLGVPASSTTGLVDSLLLTH
jgi:hypothetical protein